MKTVFSVSKLWDDNYIPLDLPEPTKLSLGRIDLRTTIVFETEFDSKIHGVGSLLFMIDKSQPNQFVAVGVSKNLVDAGFDKKILLNKKQPKAMYGDCWNKPTTAGVAGCVVETFAEWLAS